MSAINVVVFDWDGTLSDSAARIVVTMQQAFQEHGLEAPTAEAVRDVVGLGLDLAVARLAAQLGQAQQRQLVITYRKVYFSATVPASPLFDGAYETVAQLAREGYLLAVATGKGRTGLEHGLDESGLGAFFAVTRCADETRSKPHPQMLEEILTDLD
ncbi:MAG: HAD hydrolase-like protein, partial [Gammaproteobacteria bacterium]|nr:HAD hydrolase-like protein [Gammaproteobacteria bacterium]